MSYSTFELLVVSGTAVRDLPTLRYIQHKHDDGADAVLNLSICADRPMGRDDEGNVQFSPQWYKVVMWGEQAEAVAAKMYPGCPVVVTDAYLDVVPWQNADKSYVYEATGRPRFNLELKRGRVMVMGSKPVEDDQGWPVEEPPVTPTKTKKAA